MNTFTIEDIRSWKPCYDPAQHLPEGWSGTAIDIMEHATIPPQDKFWVVCRKDLIDAKTLRLFAVWCARQVEHLLADERSKNAIVVAEKYANGEATEVELAAARDAARASARASAMDAALASAMDAALASAMDAAWDAARVTAWASARAYAWDAAWASAMDAQIKKLAEMLKS